MSGHFYTRLIIFLNSRIYAIGLSTLPQHCVKHHKKFRKTQEVDFDKLEIAFYNTA